MRSSVRLKVTVQRETTGVLGLGGVTPQDFTAKFSFKVSNGQADSTPETVTKTLKQSTVSSIDAGTVELPRVKDGFDSYDLTMTTETTVGTACSTSPATTTWSCSSSTDGHARLPARSANSTTIGSTRSRFASCAGGSS